MSRGNQRLPPEVTRILFVKGLAHEADDDDFFHLFGKFGPIRQIRRGIASNTRGTAFVVYEDVIEAKNALDKLHGYNFHNRYLVVLYHQPEKTLMAAAAAAAAAAGGAGGTKGTEEELAERAAKLEALKEEHGVQ